MIDFRKWNSGILVWIFVVGLLIGVSAVVAYHISQISKKTIIAIETKDAEDRGKHLSMLISNELAGMSSLAKGWAVWDDTYGFVEKLNYEFIKVNLDWKTSLSALSDIHAFLVVKKDGTPVWGELYHPDLGTPVSSQVFPSGNWLEDSTWSHLLRDGAKGVISTEHGLLFVVINGIEPSSFQASSNGYLIMGRFLDKKLANRFGEIMNGAVRYGYSDSIDSEQLGANRVRVYRNKQGDSTISQIETNTLLNKPAILEVKYPRKVYVESEKMASIVYWSIMIALICGGLVLLGLGWGYRVLEVRARKKLEQRVADATKDLREAESRWRSLVVSAGNGILWFDGDARIVYLNPAMESLLNCKLAQVRGNPVHDVIHHKHSQSQECALQSEEQQRGIKLISDDILYRSDGKEIHVSYTVVPLDDDSARSGAVVIFTDITERIRMLETLRESDNRFRAMFDRMNAAILVLVSENSKPLFEIKNANPACEQIFGKSRGQLVGQDIAEIFPYFTELGILRILNRVSDSGESETVPVAFHEGAVKGWRSGFSYRVGENEMVLILFDETSRMESLIALEKSEERLRRFFDMPLIGACTMSLSGQFKDVNPRLCEITGYSKDALQQLTWMDRTPVEDLEQNTQRFKELLSESGGGKINTPIRLRHRAGHVVEIQISAMVVRNASNGPEEVIALLEDVTESTRIDQVMSFSVVLNQRSENSSAQDMTQWALMEIMRLTESDVAFAAKINEPEKKILVSLCHENEKKQQTEFNVDIENPVWAQCVNTKRNVVLNEVHELSADIRRNLFAAKLSVSRVALVPIIEQGKVSLILGIANKVSPIIPLDSRIIELLGKNLQILVRRKIAEEEVKSSEERMRIMFDSMQTGIILVDADNCRIIDANPVAAAMFGDSQDRMAGKKCNAICSEHGREYCKHAPQGSVNKNQEYNITRQDGTLLPVLKTASKVVVDGKHFVIESYVDISERKQYEIRLSAAKDAAEAANRAKSTFLANMSHEIRTPLNGVIGMNSLLIDSGLDDSQLKYARVIKSSAESLLKIVNDVLDLSKIEAERMQLAWGDFDLCDLVDSLLDNYTIAMQTKNLAFTIDFEEGMPLHFKGDQQRLMQVLQNLIENSIKFTNEGSIKLHFSEVQNELQIEIADTGIGFDVNEKTKLYQPFTQVDASSTRKYGGVGLGLAISKRLVELMSGNLLIQSEIGKGTKVILNLPMESRVPAQKEFQQTIKFVGDFAKWETPLRVAFEINGYSCTSESNQKDTVELLVREELPDSLRLIMTLPGDQQIESQIRIPIRFYEIKHLVKSWAGDLNQTRDSAEFAKSKKILLVEDNVINQKVASGLLGRLGCDFEIANDGQEALEMLAANDYALVFMDCQMPVMDGYEATKRIRQGLNGIQNPNVKIIAMTANALKGDRELCIECGMNDYLTKPITKDAVLTILKTWAPNSLGERDA